VFASVRLRRSVRADWTFVVHLFAVLTVMSANVPEAPWGEFLTLRPLPWRKSVCTLSASYLSSWPWKRQGR